MSNRLLALPLAAALVAGCQKSPAPSPPVAEVRQSVPAATPAPAPVAAPEPTGAPVDTLALPRSGPPGVDHLARAETLREEGDTAGALVEARRALADDAEDEGALSLIARLARASRQVTLAAEAYERLGRIDPEDAVPLVQAARMRLAAGNAEAAEALARSAVGRDEGNVEAWQALGRAQLSSGNLAGALRSLEQARTLEPSHGWVLNNLGFAYLRASRNPEALEVLERAAELLPEAAVVQNNLGVARERTGDLDGAQQAYARSALLAPKYVKARVNGERTAMLRSPPDAGVDGAHTPEADDGEE
ncbi:MAG TPA: tetratricopeptide repeat protein [Myxococcaceae bacterium]|nr:tetratricopeptide repeat protein [Myxococcaceae bacterium]